MRLRLSWGSGAQQRQLWNGTIRVEGGTLTNLQPLGLEPDAPAAIRLTDGHLRIRPLVPRVIDGCDVTVEAPPEAELVIQLGIAADRPPEEVRIPLSSALAKRESVSLASGGGYFIAQRAPGDRLRVSFNRPHLVFDPGETFAFSLYPDLDQKEVESPVRVSIELQPSAGGKALWSDSFDLEQQERQPVRQVEAPCPKQEGAYRLRIVVVRPEGFADRFVPGRRAKVLLSRDVEFVVVDPQKTLPRLIDRWEDLVEIDPANPNLFGRLPAWANVGHLPGLTPGPYGNTKPLVRRHGSTELIELPPAIPGNEPAWRAFVLPVKEPGTPHRLRVQLPTDRRQALAISIVEPNAAGQVVSFGRDAVLYSEQPDAAGTLEDHSLLFWPRTRSPVLLLANPHPQEAAQVGRITLQRQLTEPSPPLPGQTIVSPSDRLLACCFASPNFADSLGAAEVLDNSTRLSVDGWSTFLEGATRAAQALRHAGYNTVVLNVASRGGSLYPSRKLGGAPVFDTGLLAAGGRDPIPKDVLELLLRVCDREGLRVVPMIDLSTPWARLEDVVDSGRLSAQWVGARGDVLRRTPRGDTATAARYNPLDPGVQTALQEIVGEVLQRYQSHPSLSGVAIRLADEGYSVLPGPEWGMDAQTTNAFATATGIELPTENSLRAETILHQHRDPWMSWRASQLTDLYARLAESVASARPGCKLLLSTDGLLDAESHSTDLQALITGKKSVEEALLERGIDTAGLSKVNNLILLAPNRVAPEGFSAEDALDRQVLSATKGSSLDTCSNGQSLRLRSCHLRLPSFDSSGPFKGKPTFLSLEAQFLPVGLDERQYVAASLTMSRDISLLEGGPNGIFGLVEPARRYLPVLRSLPTGEAEVRSERAQPLIVRVYRDANATHVCCLNESPWGVRASLPLEVPAATAWQLLSSEVHSGSLPGSSPTGTLTAGSTNWDLGLPPYAVTVWRFNSPRVRVGVPASVPDSEALEQLAERIGELESRTRNLNIIRPYDRLANPGFDQFDLEGSPLQWRALLGANGVVSADTHVLRSGRASLRLASEDALGVAAASAPFPFPDTGQLLITVYAKAAGTSPNTRLHVTLFSEGMEPPLRYHHTCGRGEPLPGDWTRYQMVLDDLPVAPHAQLRLQLHLSGKGQAWVDDIQMIDLRFTDARRIELVKRLYAAKTALSEGKVNDCLRLIDDYWSRYVVEHVPPAVQHVATKPDPPAQPPQEEEKPMGERLRGFVPKLWR